jgi:hypothetical protein
VVLDVRLGAKDIGDLFLGTGGDVLVLLELRHGRLIRSGNMRVRVRLLLSGHGVSSDRRAIPA